MRESVRQAVSFIHRNYTEPITLSDISSEVFVSPFHFSRLFAQDIGISPGRYLGAVRMFEAKRLLVESSMNICDIVHSVGYSSVGTFTSRFTRLVGMSPREYRKPQVGRLMVAASKDFTRMPRPVELAGLHASAPRTTAPGTGCVRGLIEFPRPVPDGQVLVGVYAADVPQGRPVAYRVLPTAERMPFAVDGTPPGEWSLVALAVRNGTVTGGEAMIGSLPRRVTVRRDTNTWTRLSMRRMKATDVPLAVTLAPAPAAARASLACG
ncbi:helix-turn-helix transcriptional regulator [Nocardiopsis flavescens]|uniref:AraC-type DNA-binding protein n=1 Tax=Nocardiopsis flavescens TaxID=758803 RepID=A0A1M6PNT6_9ACTN|nr:AraC family transcriptional regulator [Nocardiopsis flavescens]SHK09664.1 AraC-type DNA-binding protein [Nocardiopsis flavescens]